MKNISRSSTVIGTEAKFVVVTGLSGSGKSEAIRALEDLGYFCVDNLPVALIPTFSGMLGRSKSSIKRAAVVVDMRDPNFLRAFEATFTDLREQTALEPMLLFLEADVHPTGRNRPGAPTDLCTPATSPADHREASSFPFPHRTESARSNPPHY